MTASTRAERTTVTAGRLIDDGEPLDTPTLELDPEGKVADLLRETTRPVAAAPGAGTWACLLDSPDPGADEGPRLLQWLAPDGTQPPPHVHPTSETFAGIDGELTLVVEGDPVALVPGERVSVKPGRAHTFRNDTDGVVAFSARLPSMRSVRALYTVWKRECERRVAAGVGGLADGDGPGLLETLPLTEDLHGETTMTVAPVPVQRVLWATLGRFARALGHEGIDEDATERAFWDRHVEQPPL